MRLARPIDGQYPDHIQFGASVNSVSEKMKSKLSTTVLGR